MKDAGQRKARSHARDGGGLRASQEVDVPVSTVLTLVGAAIAAGLDVLGAVSAVGTAIGGRGGQELRDVAETIGAGHAWSEAWADVDPRWRPIADALRPSWIAGAAPGASLDAAARALAGRARRDGEKAMAELGVTLALPLTLCLLPAFVLVGIVPMVIAVALGAGVSLGT